MSVISKRVLFEKAAEHPDALAALQVWFDAAVVANWRWLSDIRGNRYRLIARVVFAYRRVYIREFLTHAEYDKEGWKKWL